MQVAILDDDDVQAAIVERVCVGLGHTVSTTQSVAMLKSLLARTTFDLLVLDWVLPTSSGIEMIGWVKSNVTPAPPMLMVTGRSEEEDLVEGLEAGADDFVTKPIAEPILAARITALLRRSYSTSSRNEEERFGEFLFNPAANLVRLRGTEIQLTDKEIALALVLFRNADRALSREYILDQIVGWNPSLSSRTLDIHVSKLRTKLNLRPSDGYRLSSIYGFGYRLERVGEPKEGR